MRTSEVIIAPEQYSNSTYLREINFQSVLEYVWMKLLWLHVVEFQITKVISTICYSPALKIFFKKPVFFRKFYNWTLQ